MNKDKKVKDKKQKPKGVSQSRANPQLGSVGGCDIVKPKYYQTTCKLHSLLYELPAKCLLVKLFASV